MNNTNINATIIHIMIPKDNIDGTIPKNSTEYKQDNVKIMNPLVT